MLGACEPPNLNVLETEAGEREAEAFGYFRTRGDGSDFQYVAEVNYGASDRLGFQLQTGGSAAEGVEVVEFQVLVKSVEWASGAHAGVSGELALDHEGRTSFGALVYAVAPVGGWKAAGNIGLETTAQGDETAAVYAWRISREFGGRWSLAAEGGGEEPLSGEEDAEHYAGPSVGVRITGADAGPELRIGYLFGVSEAAPDLLMVGVSLGF